MYIVETCPKCGAELRSSVIATFPPIHRKECSACDWSWESTLNDEIIRVPFVPPEELEIEITDTFKLADATPSSPCDTCGSNLKNGGSGICNCTLGCPNITC